MNDKVAEVIQDIIAHAKQILKDSDELSSESIRTLRKIDSYLEEILEELS